MLEEVLDLLDGDVWQVRVVVHGLVAPCQARHGYRDDLLVTPAFIFHFQHANRADRNDCTGHHPALIGNQHVAGVAVVRKRMRNESVVSRVAHRGV